MASKFSFRSETVSDPNYNIVSFCIDPITSGVILLVNFLCIFIPVDGLPFCSSIDAKLMKQAVISYSGLDLNAFTIDAISSAMAPNDIQSVKELMFLPYTCFIALAVYHFKQGTIAKFIVDVHALLTPEDKIWSNKPMRRNILLAILKLFAAVETT